LRLKKVGKILFWHFSTKSKNLQLEVGDVDITTTSDAANIMKTRSRRRGDLLQQLLGGPNEMLVLLVKKIAEQFSVQTITFVLAFRPSIIATFGSLRRSPRQPRPREETAISFPPTLLFIPVRIS
jgi:hypothetical protein